MCETHSDQPGVTRRDAIVAAGRRVGAAAVAAAAVGTAVATAAGPGRAAGTGTNGGVPAVQVAPDLFVLPRDSWGADLAPRGPIAPETVQFLLVHHTASPNKYPAGGAREVLRQTYGYHTSAAKGWPDVCYEFFVDHDGVVYEGRYGALAGPVTADATGGSQGFAQLVCLVGDFTSTDPAPAMVRSLIKVLAWLADRYGIDTTPGATTTFVSRGSQLFKAGVEVATATIAGHRDMSATGCPGDHVYGMLAQVREQVHAQRAAWAGALWQAQRLGPTTP